MKRSIMWLVFVPLTALASGCASAVTHAPSTFTPSPISSTFTPKPTSTFAALLSVTPTSNFTDTPLAPSGSNEISEVANIQTIEFIGKKFELKFKATDQPVQIYEYYLANESPSDWFELVEIQVYPVHPSGNTPIDFAKRTADAFIQQYPDMRYAILTDNSSDAVILHFFYPTSTREGYIEFDAFKYFSNSSASQVIGFHYAKNIEGINSSRSFDAVLGDITKTQREIESALAEFILFSK